MSEADEIARNELRAHMRREWHRFMSKKDSRWSSPMKRAASARIARLIDQEMDRLNEIDRKARP